MTNDLPRFALHVRSDTGWSLIRTLDTLDEAGQWIEPGCRVVPTEIPPKPCPRFAFAIGLLFAAVIGFSAAAVLMRGGAL